MTTAAETLLEKFDAVKPIGSGKWAARCPAHDDRTPSLSITRNADRWLVHCHAGCVLEDVLAAAKMTAADLFDEPSSNGHGRAEIVTTYDYVDEGGDLLYQVVRLSPKGFRQRRPDGAGGWVWKLGDVRRVPYRLPRVISAVERGEDVMIVEGEKDVEALERLGVTATCNPGGAGKWRPAYAEFFRGAKVTIVADRDDAGRDHARQVAASLKGIAIDIDVVEPTSGKDITAHLAAGGGLDGLVPLRHEESAPAPRAEPAEPPMSTLVSFESIVAKPVRWAWRDRIALGKITALAGRPKIGKGLLYSDTISRVTRGTLEGDLGGPGDVILVTTEDDAGDTLKPRLMAAGADLSRVAIFQMGTAEEPVPFRVPQDAAELGRRVAERNAALVVIDPLVEFVDGKIDSHKSQPVRHAIAALNSIARESGCAVLVVFHLNKGASTDPLLRHEASAAFTQVVRGGLMLGHDPEDPDGEDGSQRVLAVSSSNLAAIAPSIIYRIDTAQVVGDTEEEIITARVSAIGESSAGAQDLLQGRPDGEEQSGTDDAEALLHDELADGPRPADEVIKQARKLGISDKQLRRARGRLNVEAAKAGFRGGWEWSLPKAPSPRRPPDHREKGRLRRLRDEQRDSGPSEGAQGAQGAPLSGRASSGAEGPPSGFEEDPDGHFERMLDEARDKFGEAV